MVSLMVFRQTGPMPNTENKLNRTEKENRGSDHGTSAYFWGKLFFPIEKTPRFFPRIFPEASWESLEPQYMVFQYRKTTI